MQIIYSAPVMPEELILRIEKFLRIPEGKLSHSYNEYYIIDFVEQNTCFFRTFSGHQELHGHLSLLEERIKQEFPIKGLAIALKIQQIHFAMFLDSHDPFVSLEESLSDSDEKSEGKVEHDSHAFDSFAPNISGEGTPLNFETHSEGLFRDDFSL